MSYFKRDMKAVYLLALIKFLQVLPYLSQTPFETDELTFMTSARSFSWGHVDDFPLTIWLVQLSTHLGGENPLSLRLLPLIAGCVCLVVAGKIAQTLGGRYRAQILAALAVLIAPHAVFASAVHCVRSYEGLIYLVSTLIFLKLDQALRTPHGHKLRYSILLGVCMGLGILNKANMLLFMAALALGLLCTRSRRLMLSRYPYLSLLIALCMLLPSMLWWQQHDWAGLVFLLSVPGANPSFSLPDFLLLMLIGSNWLTVPLWAAGWIFRAPHPYRHSCRALSWGLLFMVQFYLALHNSSLYLLPVLLPFCALGSVWWEKRCSSGFCTHLLRVYALILFLGALYALPVLVGMPECFPRDEQAQRVTSALCLSANATYTKFLEPLRNEGSWPQVALALQEIVAHKISEHEKKSSLIISSDCSVAAAVEIYTQPNSPCSLPVACPTLNYYYRPLPGFFPKTVIGVQLGGQQEEVLNDIFEEKSFIAIPMQIYNIPEKQTLDITIYRKRRPLQAAQNSPARQEMRANWEKMRQITRIQ